MIANIADVTMKDVRGRALDYKSQGYRLVTMSCVDVSETNFEILYHFDKDLEMHHLRMSVPKGEKVPSISNVYFCAFLVENEMQDHFGLCFEGLAIDYGQTLYLEEEVRTTPFCKFSVSRKAQ